jgi:hypothetical protein
MHDPRPTHTLWRRSGMKTRLGLAVLVDIACSVATVASQMRAPPSRAAVAPSEPTAVERGRYLVPIAGCHDGHTAGDVQAGGHIPELHGLTGETLGYRGPWGTTYAINLRLYMPNFSAAPWVQLAQHLQTRPPMPWCVLRHMTDAELDAMYHVIRSLGPAGNIAPAYLPPEQEPPPPYGQFPGPPP